MPAWLLSAGRLAAGAGPKVGTASGPPAAAWPACAASAGLSLGIARMRNGIAVCAAEESWYSRAHLCRQLQARHRLLHLFGHASQLQGAGNDRDSFHRIESKQAARAISESGSS
ncbi:hypothetical protein ABPG75_006904 [Micractinium tetrahymenae]